MDTLFNDKSYTNGDFILNWMLFNWHVFNFTEYSILQAFKVTDNHVQHLIKVAFLYTNEHFVKELLDNVPSVAKIFADGNSLLHLICQSSIQPAEKAKLAKVRHDHLFSEPNKNGLLPVHIAILNKNSNLCKELVNFKDIDMNILTKDKQLAPLHIAAHFGMNERVTFLLNRSDINVNIVDSNGDTPLHHAVGRRHFTTFALLASDKRCNRSILNNSGKQAEDDLAVYVTKCSIDEFMNVAQSVSLDILDKNGNSPMHLCCMSAQDCFEKFKYLVDQHRYMLKKANRFQNRPIHIAARNNDKRYLEYILKHHIYININARGHRKRTPLHIACFKGYEVHVGLLIQDFDININSQDADGNTPLHVASIRGYYGIMKVIMAFSWCKTDIANNLNRTAMDVAPKSVKMAINADKCTIRDLQDMLESSADKYVDVYNNTLLHICASSRSFSKGKVSFLVARNRGSMFKHNNKGFMPIHTAAAEDNVEVVELLAKEGCLNALSYDKRTPLHIASCYCCNSTLVRLLMFEDIDVNMQDVNGDTPSHLAANNDMETLYLIENHPKYIHGLRNKQGNTPHDICSTIQTLKIICSTGSSTQLAAMVNNLGEHFTIVVVKCLLSIVLDSKTDKLRKLEILLSLNVEVLENYSDVNGYSLFHLAWFSQDAQLLQMLVNNSQSYACLNRIDNSGYTVWDYASLNADIEAIKILEAHPLFEQSAIGLSALTSRSFQITTQISSFNVRVAALQKIKDQLWCSTEESIQIYDCDLAMIRDIKPKIGRIYSITDLGHNVAVASDDGLFVLTYIGGQVRRIHRGHVSDVRFHQGQLFCVSGKVGRGSVEVQVYDTRTWERIRLVESAFWLSHRYRHTLHVGSEYITIACVDYKMIETMTHKGDLVGITHGSGIGDFKYPRLSHCGSDAVLMVDSRNHQLQLLHQGEWSRVLLEPQPIWPFDAAYVSGALFVLTGYFGVKQSIIKYVPT